MAVIFNNKKTKDKEQEQEAAPLGQPQIINPGTAAPISASSYPAAPAAPGAGTSSGSFTNLKSYIDANKNFNKDGGGLAGKVVSNLTNQGDKVKSDVQGATSTFNTQKDAQVGQMQQGAGLVQQAVVNPNAFVQNQQNVDSLATARDAAYTGPKSFADLEGQQNQGALQANADNFSTNVEQGKTEKGRFNLLRDMFGRPSYTSGQQNLDNLLIQGQKDQIQKINNTGSLASDVNRTLAQGSAAAAQGGSQAVLDAQGIRQQTRQALNDRVSAENLAVQGRLTSAQESQNLALFNLVKGLNSGSLSQRDADRLGLVDGQTAFLKNLQGNQNLITRGEGPTLETVANEGNYNTIAALRNLIGGASSEDSSKILQQFGDASKADSFDSNNYNLNKDLISKNTAAALADPGQKTLANLKDAMIREQESYEQMIIKDDANKKRADAKKNDEFVYSDYGRKRGEISHKKNQKDRQVLIDDLNSKLANTYGTARPIKVQNSGSANIDNYNEVDTRTGQTGEQLLRSLGLLK